MHTWTYHIIFYTFTVLWMFFIVELILQDYYRLSIISIVIYIILMLLLELYNLVRSKT